MTSKKIDAARETDSAKIIDAARETDSAKKVGIRYCGGCNPRYDRGAMVKRVCDKHPEWDVGIAAEGVSYDLLLVVGGCSSCCAAYEQFTADRVLKIWTDAEDVPEEYR